VFCPDRVAIIFSKKEYNFKQPKNHSTAEAFRIPKDCNLLINAKLFVELT
jgi:hypothetical protein